VQNSVTFNYKNGCQHAKQTNQVNATREVSLVRPMCIKIRIVVYASLVIGVFIGIIISALFNGQNTDPFS